MLSFARRRWYLVLAVYLASSVVWGPAAEAAFHLNRAGDDRPTKGLSFLPDDMVGLVTLPQEKCSVSLCPPPVAPEPVYSAPSGKVDWDALAQCESGGNWQTDAYHDGGLQFHPGTWNNHKPEGYPAHAYEASREQQIVVAERTLEAEGRGAWPPLSRPECN